MLKFFSMNSYFLGIYREEMEAAQTDSPFTD